MRPAAAALAVVVAACNAGEDIPPPMIATLVPDHGPVAASVMIQGDFFCHQHDDGEGDPIACAQTGSVTFDDTPAIAGVYMDRLIVVEVPDLPGGTYDVVVTVAGRRSNAPDFLIEAP
jgi:hypothetical protein